MTVSRFLRWLGTLSTVQALAASSDWGSTTAGGEHWRWECDNCDTPIPIDPVALLGEFATHAQSATGLALNAVIMRLASIYFPEGTE